MENQNQVQEVQEIQEQTQPKRSGFITFWLWMMVILNPVGGVINLYHSLSNFGIISSIDEMYRNYYWGTPLGIYDACSELLLNCLSFVVMGCAIMMLKWKKSGLWLYIGCMALAVLLNGSRMCIWGANEMAYYIIAGYIMSPAIMALILSIKKNGVSCWSQMK